MKTCPKCNKSWPEDYECCPECGAHFPSGFDLSGAVFTGGFKPTIINGPKDPRQLLEEKIQAYRIECKKLYTNGLISKEGEMRLREFQAALGLADELALPIKEEIQQQSRKPMKQLSEAALNGIRQTKTIIEQNSSTALNRQLQQLNSWMKEYDNDALKSYYFQLSSMLEPTRYTERYEKSAKNEYWEVYWAFIAYLLQDNGKQAYDAQALSGRLQYDHPEQNEVLLSLAGRLMQNDPIEDIKREYSVRAVNCSPELQLLRDTVNDLLQRDWTTETIAIRPVYSFYVNTLFKSFVETQKERGKKKRIENIHISRVEQGRRDEINRQKSLLLQKFQEVDDIEKACHILGIPYLTFRDWLNEDPTFNSSYNEIVRRIEAKRFEEAEKIRIAQESEERTKQQKSQFKFKYEQNGCDFIKTCSDLGVDSDTVRMWKASDKAFDDGLTIIEREHEKQLQELFVQFYESNGCDLQKACAAAGVSAERVNGWRKSNKEFDGVLTAIDNERIQEIKDAFVKCYENNGCDLLKTCKEMGLDSRTVHEWRREYPSFRDNLEYIERQHAVSVSKEKSRKRLKKFKKILPWLLIAILSIVCVLGILKLRDNYRFKKDKEQTEKEYELAIAHFNDAFSRVDTSKEGLDALSNAAISLKQILELENTPFIDGRNDSEPLKSKFDARVKELLENYQKKTSLTPEKGGNEIIWDDGANGQKRVKDIINTLQK